jgi:hypothetical protein
MITKDANRVFTIFLPKEEGKSNVLHWIKSSWLNMLNTGYLKTRLQGYDLTRLNQDSSPSPRTSTTKSTMAPSMEADPVAPVAQVSLKQAEVVTPAKDTTHEEYQYLNLIREILDNGEHRPDR